MQSTDGETNVNHLGELTLNYDGVDMYVYAVPFVW